MADCPFDTPFNRRDLDAAGLGRGHLRTWLARGVVVQGRPGVYLPTNWSFAADLITGAMFGSSRIAPFSVAAQAHQLWTPPRPHPEMSSALRANGVHGAFVITAGSLRLPNIAWTALNLARYQPLQYAAISLDSALRLGVDRLDLQRLSGLLPARKGSSRVELALALANPLSESPLETVGRILMHVAGVPEPILQLNLRTEGGLFRADFAWPEQRVLVEADGEGKYADPEEERRERRRRNLLIKQGWRIHRYGWTAIPDSDPAFIRNLANDLRALS